MGELRLSRDSDDGCANNGGDALLSVEVEADVWSTLRMGPLRVERVEGRRGRAAVGGRLHSFGRRGTPAFGAHKEGLCSQQFCHFLSSESWAQS